jgi:hypothetical protein
MNPAKSRQVQNFIIHQKDYYENETFIYRLLDDVYLLCYQ